MEKKENNDNGKPFQDPEFKGLKVAFKGILILTFIIITAVLLGSIFAPALTSTKQFVFSNEYLYTSLDDSNPINSTKTFNLRNQTVYSERFNGTYTFDGELGLTGTSISYVDVDASTRSSVVDYRGHSEVLKIDDNSGVSYTIDNNLDNIESGTVESWFLVDEDSSMSPQFYRFHDGAVLAIVMIFESTGNVIKIADDGGWQTLGLYEDDAWYHIRYDFECGAGGYMGLGADTGTVYINGVDVGTYDFQTAVEHFSVNRIYTGLTSNGRLYVDGVGYSWDNHPLGSGNFSDYTVLDTLEVDAWQFTLEGLNDGYFSGDDNLDGFTDVEASGDNVNCYSGWPSALENRNYTIGHESIGTGTWGFQRAFSETDWVYDISWGINVWVMDETDDLFCLSIESSDNTEIVRLVFRYVSGTEIKLQQWDGFSHNDLETGLSLETSYDLEVYLNYYHGEVQVVLWENGTYIDEYSFMHNTYGKSGIGKLYSYLYTPDASSALASIDYIGLYHNGTSLSDDFGYEVIDLETTLDVTAHNFIETRGTGTFGVMRAGASIDDYMVMSTAHSIFHVQTWENQTQFRNTADVGVDVGNQFIALWVSGGNYSCTYMDIYGVKATEGVNDYYVDMTYGNVNINYSYFWVDDSSNYLRWNFTSDSAGDTEWIKAEFDIINEFAVNSSFQFTGYYGGLVDSQMVVQYTTGTSTPLEIRGYMSSMNQLLPPEYAVDTFYVLITDNGETIQETFTGYVFGVYLNYLPNYALTLTTLSMLEILAPLIIILLPTMALWKKYGRMVVLPMLILMSVVCFATGLIPSWVFFVMLLTFGSLILLQRRYGGVRD